MVSDCGQTLMKKASAYGPERQYVDVILVYVLSAEKWLLSSSCCPLDLEALFVANVQMRWRTPLHGASRSTKGLSNRRRSRRA